ncbi:MAG TPA: Rrf2 family transcriptional regulator [Luteolibacter sp.]|nr:Rrf2 family transcriptional regulator [Luteolibacter sp.]
MRISQKVEYALRALAQLAKRHDGRTLTRLEELAQREAVSPNFLIQILSDLRRAGIVESRRGQAGGYLLTRAPEAIALSQIIDAIDPSILQGTLADDGESGPALRRTWGKISDNLRAELDRTTLENLIVQPGEGMFYI